MTSLGVGEENIDPTYYDDINKDEESDLSWMEKSDI